MYPAAYRVGNMISVGATTPDDHLASFSNRGAAFVDIAAPGVKILSTIPGDKLAEYEGTSMATPHVVGCAALLNAIDPKRKAVQLRQLLLDSADKIASLRGLIGGERRLNCGAAVR